MSETTKRVRLSKPQIDTLAKADRLEGVTSAYCRRSIDVLLRHGLIEWDAPPVRLDWGATYKTTTAGKEWLATDGGRA